MISLPSEIERKFYLDHCWKNIRIHFPNGERQDICNDLIVKDTVSFKESLCSQNKLKFGLCESPVFECEVVGVGNIKGASIEVSCEVECEASVSGAVWRADIQKYVYPVPYGMFVVDSCQRQADMQHRKVVAYGGSATMPSSAGAFERAKTWNWHNDVVSHVTYKANAFLLAISNLDTRDYSRTIFNETDISFSSSILNDLNMARNDGGDWYRIDIYRRMYDSAEIGKNQNSLFYISPEVIKKDGLSTIIDGINTLLADHGAEDVFSDIDWEEKLISHDVWFQIPNTNPSGVPEIWTNSAGLKDKLSYVFYPYFGSECSSFVRQARSVEYITLSINGVQVDRIDLYEDYAEAPNLIKLDPKDSFFNNETVAYSWEKMYSTWNKMVPPEDFDNVTTLQTVTELCGFLGYYGRNKKFELLDIKRQFGLVPESTLYPGVSVFPESVTGGYLYPNDYQSCWYDDEYSKLFGKVYCKYKQWTSSAHTSTEEVEYNLYFNGFTVTSDEDDYQVYDLSNSEYFKRDDAVWDDSTFVASLCSKIAANLLGVTYMPVDFKGRGLPHVEAGDTFEILTRTGESITTIVLNRTLTGEQTLTDSYKSV